jgi:hypothetical protein
MARLRLKVAANPVREPALPAVEVAQDVAAVAVAVALPQRRQGPWSALQTANRT